MANQTKHLPHVRVMAKKYAQNKAEILAATHISEEAYNTLQFNNAIAWIRKAIWNDEEVVSAIINQPMFWPWWANQWNMRDDEFLHNHLELVLYVGVSSYMTAEELRSEWLLTHDVRNIELLPSPIWAKAAYDKVMNNFIKTSAKKGGNDA